MRFRAGRIAAAWFVALSLLSATSARASRLAYQISPPVYQQVKPGERVNTIKFALYLDPLHINWIAIAEQPELITVDGEDCLGSTEAGYHGIDDYALVTLTDPQGKQSPTFTLDQNDEAMIPFGPQAYIYGEESITPRIVRSDPAGNRMMFTEGGPATGWMDEAGLGYYTFDFAFINAYGEGGGHREIYIVMDVEETFRKKPPIFIDPRRGYLYWGGSLSAEGQSGGGGRSGYYIGQGDDDDDDDDDDDGITSGGGPIVPQPTPTPPPEEPEPIIPEPGTLGLTGLGLAALMAWRRGRAKKRL